MNKSVEQWDIKKKAVTSEKGVVAAQHLLAARAGAGMLASGGNAIDAAVAAAFALAAVEPWMCGLGGSGYMVVWNAEDQSGHVLDFQGMLAQAIDPADYPLDPDVPESIMGFPGVIDRRNIVGYGAMTVPGAVKGLSRALDRFGRLGLDTVLDPAIRLAARGLPCDWFTTLQIALTAADLARDPLAAATYLPGGAPAAPEQFLPLGRLADTLKTLAENGPDCFYTGNLAESICADPTRFWSMRRCRPAIAAQHCIRPVRPAAGRGLSKHSSISRPILTWPTSPRDRGSAHRAGRSMSTGSTRLGEVITSGSAGRPRLVAAPAICPLSTPMAIWWH
jgi:gamma-glutamyltranspeptidase/glutathione hydrolase